MYTSEIFRESAFSPTLPTEKVRRLIAKLRATWTRLDTGSNKAQALHNLLRLEVVSALGQPPAGYGWHIDTLLTVRTHWAGEPLRAAPELPPGWDDPDPPDRGFAARVYRVPRVRRRPKLQLLEGGMSNGAA
jgi:hypothetical protein